MFGLRALVVGRVAIGSSLGSGYNLFRRNLGRSFLVWLVGFALSLGVGLTLLIAALIVGLVLAAPAAALSFAGLGTASLVAGVVAAVVLLILFVVASAAASTFNHAYWTLAYPRLTAPPEVAAGR